MGVYLTNSVASLRHQAQLRGKSGPVVAWYGDNTDWIGLRNCLQRNLSPRNAITRKSTGLVIGAGGMCRAAIYAMVQLGCRKVFIYNRTMEHAGKVASHFNSRLKGSLDVTDDAVVEVLKACEDPWPSTHQPPTLIVSAIPAHSINDNIAANFTMPQQWLTSASGGVVVEVCCSNPQNFLLLY
jgi:shikimate 5-dehydrogenase